MNLNIMSPIGYTGYGYAGLNIIKALVKNNTNIGLTPIGGNIHYEQDTDGQILKNCIENQVNIPYDATTIKIWHQFDLLTRPGNGRYLAFPFFEIDKLPTKDIYHLNFPDEIIVSSKWAKNILINNSITKPIHVIPLGVDGTIFKPQDTQSTSQYVFCTIGKWEKRKAHDIIIECFSKAFSSKDNVELWMVTHNPFLNREEEQYWINLVQSSPLSNKIKIFPRLNTHADVANVISYSSCGIYISRGEGWNMELLETMSMNKPVIASNYSAHTEYCNNENSFLVDMNETEPAIDNKWFHGGSNWGKISDKEKNQTIEYMKYCYANNITTNLPGLATAQELNWNNTAKTIQKLL